MNHVAIGLQLRPNKDSHFEVTGHLLSKQESADNWYGANQTACSRLLEWRISTVARLT